MRGSLANASIQAEQVRLDYQRAVREGNTKLAEDIYHANPDLQTFLKVTKEN